jgi:hypothetical protein
MSLDCFHAIDTRRHTKKAGVKYVKRQVGKKERVD